MPLYIVLESGRRMLNSFYKLSKKEQELSVKNIKKVSTEYELTLSYRDKALNWMVHSKISRRKRGHLLPLPLYKGERRTKTRIRNLQD